jgi:molybdopterin-guanine dinucleotide biosynthesis protein A
MGRPKGSALLDGLTLAERAARSLRPLCGSVLVSVAPGMANPARRYATVEDTPPAFRGPLAGIDAAMAVTGEADLLVLACDYPHVDTALLRKLLEAARPEDELVFLVDTKGRDHPLVGLWRRCTRDRIHLALELRLYTVRGLLAELATRRVGPKELPSVDLAAALLNANDPGDIGDAG